MRIFRLAAILLLIVVVLLSGAVIALLVNQDRILRLVVEEVNRRTPFEFSASAAHLRFRNHLIVEFEHPRFSRAGHELAKLAAVRAVVSYRALLSGTIIPVHSLVLVNPELQLPPEEGFAVRTPIPRVGTELVDTIVKILHGLERSAWRIELADGTVRAPDGRVLFDQLGVLAYRRHRQAQLWRAEFGVRVIQEPFDGIRAAGQIRVGTAENMPVHQFAAVSVRFWNDEVNRVAFNTAMIQARFSGSAKFSLAEDGSATGSANMTAIGLTLSAMGSGAPENLGDCTVEAAFSETQDTARIERLRLSHEQTLLAVGDAELTGLQEPKQALKLRLSAKVPLEVTSLRSHLRYFRRIPESLITSLNKVQSGRLFLTNVELSTTTARLFDSPDDAVLDGIDITASLGNVSFALPENLKLPDVNDLNLQFRYARNVFSATQGSATLDQSTVKEVKARLEFAKKFDALSYEASFVADAGLKQLYPAITAAMARVKVNAIQRIEALGGRIAVRASASGSFKLDQPRPPSVYRIAFEANNTVLQAKGVPGPVDFETGVVTIEPGTLKFSKLRVKATGGDGLVDGTIGLDPSGPHVRDVTIELHDMPAGLWLALAIEPDSLSVEGKIGGKVRIRADAGKPNGVLVNGGFVLNSGSVQFSFLRSPMKVQGTTIRFDGRSLMVAMPSSILEGSPIDFLISIADLSNPTLRIDANVQRLDFEAMRFIRLPWSPAAPPVVFALPVTGHVEVQKGNLSKLPMTSIKTDFWRINGDWKVYNYTANTFKGRMELELSGRAKDDWLHMQGKMVDMDVSQMFLLSGDRTESPIVGKIWIAADLWADTNNDFFETLGGRIAMTLRDGTLNRFKLLSRMLSLIDLKSWLTAKFPDPMVAGLPFEVILVDLKGDRGVFDTENFFLQGPVLEITAEGKLNFANDYIDMILAAFPLNSFSWAVSKIPLIGENIANSAGTLVAAYFQAHGPLSDPSVSPMPITSIAEIVKKTLGLPINVIRPHTIE